MVASIALPHEPPYLVGLNPEQRMVALHDQGPLLVGAVAGSGKTHTLISRVAHLIDRGVDPGRILCVTFGSKAAKEMGARAERVGASQATFSTWHSLCGRILRDDRTVWGGWRLDDKDRHRTFVKEAVGYKHLNWREADVTKIRGFITKCKANLLACDSAGAAELASKTFGRDAGKAVQAYAISQDLVETIGLLTFDDMICFAARHLQEDEDARLKWASRWDYVMQDECQDANLAQVTIAELLAREHRNYMQVGDVAQAIYSFRGSSPQYMVDFPGQWSAQVVNMNRNYRCAHAVVRAANNVIRPATIRLPVDMVAEQPRMGTARAVKSGTLDDEGAEFATWVTTAVGAGDATYADHVCLFRTNAQSRALEEALLGARVPYVVVGATSFYERKEVKDLLAYLRVALGRDADGDGVKRCINAPFRFLGAAFVERVMDLAKRVDGKKNWSTIVRTAAEGARIQARQVQSANEWINLVERCEASLAKDEKPGTVLADLVTRTGYIAWLEKEEGEESIESSHGANVRELIRVAERFPTAVALLEYIDESIAAGDRQRREPVGDRVTLMSVHRSKGLEWRRVWISGCNQMILPHAKGDLEEERRLMYVAMTRAKEDLVCSYVETLATRKGVAKAEPSCFLVQSGLIDGGAQ